MYNAKNVRIFLPNNVDFATLQNSYRNKTLIDYSLRRFADFEKK